MKKNLFVLLSVFLLISTVLPTFSGVAKASESSTSLPVIENEVLENIEENENDFTIIESSELKSVFSVVEEDGKTYEYESLVLNENTENEKIQVNKYLIENEVRSTLVESSEELVYNNQFNNNQIMAKAACHGKTGTAISWAGTRASIYLDSCITKKIVAVIDGSSGATGAIAGIGALIRGASKLAKFVPYVSAIAGVLWFAGAGIKAISGNGKYGIGFHMARNPFTGKINTAIGVPWRQ